MRISGGGPETQYFQRAPQKILMNRGVTTPVRMATIKKRKKNTCWLGCGEKGTFVPCWWEYKLMQPLRKTV